MSSSTSNLRKLFQATERGSMCNCFNEEEQNWFRLMNQFQTLATNRFRWENLPDGVESRHIEQALYLNGVAIFYKDESNTLRCLPAFGVGTPDLYGDWVEYNGFGFNGNTETKTIDNCIPVFENDVKFPLVNHVYHYTKLIAEIDRTIHINTKQQRRPYLISATKDMELSAKQLKDKIEKDEFIIQDKGISGKRKDDLTIEVLETKSDFLIDRLNEAKHELESDLLDVLGINNNSNQDKRERLLVDEVNINNGYILNNLDVAFKCREYACKKLNEKWGLNVRVVKVRDMLDPQEKEENKNIEDNEEGENIG